VSEPSLALSHRLLLRLATGGARASECRAIVRELPGYWLQTGPVRVERIDVFVCDQCDLAIELSRASGVRRLFDSYPYRPNLKIGKRKRKDHG
jgi:hypothetical protein